MKIKTLLACILLLNSAAAFADWELIAKTDDGEKYYMDSASLKLEEGVARIWTYMDFPTPTDVGALSISSHLELDCKNERQRDIYVAIYEKHDLKGKVIASGAANTEWEPIPSYSTMGSKMYKYVCMTSR